MRSSYSSGSLVSLRKCAKLTRLDILAMGGERGSQLLALSALPAALFNLSELRVLTLGELRRRQAVNFAVAQADGAHGRARAAAHAHAAGAQLGRGAGVAGPVAGPGGRQRGGRWRGARRRCGAQPAGGCQQAHGADPSCVSARRRSRRQTPRQWQPAGRRWIACSWTAAG